MKADEIASLSQQLSVVKRRVKVTIQELTQAMESLPAHPEMLELLSLEEHAKRHDLFGYCIRLEVALDETRQLSKKLKDCMNAVANGHASVADPFTTRFR